MKDEPVAVILTALDIETRAVLRHLGTFTTEAVFGTQFFRGTFAGWGVAVAEVGPGNVGAAAIGVRALDHYKPDVALFVGVAGGVKDVGLGDVVVATKVHGYETGRDTAQDFVSRPDPLKVAHSIDQAGRALRQQTKWKDRLNPEIVHEEPEVFVAPIAAGEKVVASRRSTTARLLKRSYGDAVAVEMEGRGFLESVHINAPVQGGVVRGISDLLSGKAAADKAGSQRRAADVASAVAFEILSILAPTAAKVVAAPVVPMPVGPTSTAPTNFIETPSTFSPSAFFEANEVLARVGVPDVDQVSFAFARAPDAYLRIIPNMARDRPIPLAALKSTVQFAELLRPQGYGGFSDLNRYGAILFDPDGSYPGGPAPLHLATQLFPNGEIWSVSNRIVVHERGHRPDWLPIPFIPAAAFERVFYRTLHKSVSLAVNSLDLAFPCTVELGLLNLKGTHLAVAQDDLRGPLHFDEAIVRSTVTDGTSASIDAVLLDFFREVHDKTGYARPDVFEGFPPGPL